MSDAAFVTYLVGSILAIIAAIFIVGMVSAYYIEKNQCYSFGRQSNREVKFVKFTPVSWDCLTPTGNGKWISTSNLREFGSKP